MLTSLVPYVVFVEVISGGARREHGADGNICKRRGKNSDNVKSR